MVGLSPRTMEYYRTTGQGPAFSRLGGRVRSRRDKRGHGVPDPWMGALGGRMDQHVVIFIACGSIFVFLVFAMGVAHWQERRDNDRKQRRREGETLR